MEEARAEQVIKELQLITRIIYTGEIPEIKPSGTLLVKNIKPSETPFIKKDASGRALFYIIEGSAGVDIGQPERIMVPHKRTVGEMSMAASVLNVFDNLGTVVSRTADVYAEEPMKLIVFNYQSVIDILEDPNPAFRKYRHQVLVSLNRVMYKKLAEVNQNYVEILMQYGLENADDEGMILPMLLQEGLMRFLKNMRTIPNMHISPHELRGTLIQQGQPNPAMVMVEQGKLKVSIMVTKGEDEEAESRLMVLDTFSSPTMVGEASILNVGAISGAQVEALGKTVGYRMPVQNLLRHLQRYPEMFENFFKLLLELNYFRTVRMMQKTSSL